MQNSRCGSDLDDMIPVARLLLPMQSKPGRLDSETVYNDLQGDLLFASALGFFISRQPWASRNGRYHRGIPATYARCGVLTKGPLPTAFFCLRGSHDQTLRTIWTCVVAASDADRLDRYHYSA